MEDGNLASQPAINWWPYHKMWAALGGAAVGGGAAVLSLAQPLAVITGEVLTLSPEGVNSAEQVWIVVLSMIGLAIAGYMKTEPPR